MPNRRSVYLIDDDPVFTAIGEILFAAAGIRSISVLSNSEAALQAMAANALEGDIAVLGLNMAGLDGLAVMRILANAGFKGFVAVSSEESTAIREASGRLGRLLKLKMLGDVVKPLREPDIRRLLEEAASRDNEKEQDGLYASSLDGELGSVYQPKVDSQTGEIVGAEALMRVRLKDGTLLSPFAYLERATLQGKLGEETLKFLKIILLDLDTFRKSGHFPVISVNVPAPVAEESGFPARFATIVQSHGISPSQITIELTESALPTDMAKLVEVLTRFRMAGFGLALDDFGTGMSNFDILRMLPFNELKIDRSLAQAADHDPLSCGIIETCATISRELGMKLVAEGVETEEQEMTLKRLGVTVFQGFLFGRGMPRDEFQDLLNLEIESGTAIPAQLAAM